jgi:hypothetical protein
MYLPTYVHMCERLGNIAKILHPRMYVLRKEDIEMIPYGFINSEICLSELWTQPSFCEELQLLD